MIKRPHFSVAIFVALLAAAPEASAQDVPGPTPELTALERLATQPGSEVALAADLGAIDSAGTRLNVTALILEDPASTANPTRGVRIDLQNATQTDRFYIDEGELLSAKRELTQLDCGLAQARDPSDAPYRVRGIARCRPSRETPQAYCPGYRIGPDFEGLSLSTFAGNHFQFASVRPAQLADLIEHAIMQFGVVATPPSRERIGLPAQDVALMRASAIRHFPALAASPGIKAAGYSGPGEENVAWAIFQPFARDGDMAHALSVDCKRVATGGGDWDCAHSQARGYLTRPDQDWVIVITGALERDEAVALTAFARGKMMERLDRPDVGRWFISSIRPPEEANRAFLLFWRDGRNGAMTFSIKRTAPRAQERFDLLEAVENNRNPCS